jgi:hypothetical protein
MLSIVFRARIVSLAGEKTSRAWNLNRPFSGATSCVFCAYTANTHPEEAFAAARNLWL